MPSQRRLLILASVAAVALAAFVTALPLGRAPERLFAATVPAVARAPFPAWAHHSTTARAATTPEPGLASRAAPPSAQRGSGQAIAAAGTVSIVAAAVPAVRRRPVDRLAGDGATPSTPTPPPRAV